MNAKKTIEKGRWIPKVGDGLWDINQRWCIILGVNTRGIHALTDKNPSTSPGDIVSLRVRYKNGRIEEELPIGDVRCRETFLDYLTRPTGFGKMRWEIFAVLQAILVWGIVSNIHLGDWWIAVIAFVVVNAVLTIGTYFNFTRRWV